MSIFNPKNWKTASNWARRIGLLAAFSGQIFITLGQGGAPDSAKVQGPMACGECHKAEFEVWKATHHFETFNQMHRESKAREIADKLGITRIKNDSVCLNCHYTSKMDRDKSVVISGVSCESCHGAAQAWIDVHNDVGGAEARRDQESREHKVERIAKSVAGGMTRPSETYEIASKCFRCHIVPQESVVNAGHAPGSDFELVAWLQGEVIHNFLANPKVNRPPSVEHRRTLYLAGRILDLEYSLRSVAKGTTDGIYATAMSQRVTNALVNLRQIEAVVTLPELKEIIAAGNSAELKPKNTDAINGVADRIATLGRRLTKSVDATRLGAMDTLLPAADKYKGKTVQR